MRFTARHRFHASPSAVTGVLADPSFYADLVLPDLSAPELVEHRRTGEEVLVVLRYEFVGSLDPIARRLLGGDRLTWVQQVRVQLAAGSGSLVFEAESEPKRLHGAARFTLGPDDGDTVRELEGDLVVAIPVIGGTAERRIVPGLLHRLDLEAAAVDERLRRA